MTELSVTLLRERFVITDTMPVDFGDAEPVIALSNRMVLPLIGREDGTVASYVVRAHNMHGCTRFAAHILQEFAKRPSNPQAFIDSLNWNRIHSAVTDEYEAEWNPDFWVAVYFEGRAVFESGARHSFLDIIEQCDARNKGHYEKSLEIAEDAFKQAGKFVSIAYDSNMALNLHMVDNKCRCGIIMRGPNKTTTFNFSAHRQEKTDSLPLEAASCLYAAAEYLEAVQLAFLLGMSRMKLEYEMISPSSPEAQKADAAHGRLKHLSQEIKQFENLFVVSYRPERPDIKQIISDSEAFAKKSIGIF